MSTKKHKKSNTDHDEDTADKIAEAATRLFAEKGYDGVSTKEICDLAKVNISSLHYHFETKEKLFLHIFEGQAERFLETLKPLMSVPDTLEETRVRLEIFVEGVFDFYTKKRDISRIIQQENWLDTARSQEVFDMFNPLIKHIHNFFIDLQKKKFIQKELSPDILTTIFLRFLRPHFDTLNAKKKACIKVDFEKPEDLSRFTKQFVHVFLYGISKKD